jgi:hypothetical protein
VSLLSLLGNGSVNCIPPFIARQRFYEHVPAETNTCNNGRIVGRVIFYAVHALSKESLWVCQGIPLSLLGNGSVKTLWRKRRIVGGVVFYVVHVVSKESRRLVHERTSCYILMSLGVTSNCIMRGFITCTPRQT